MNEKTLLSDTSNGARIREDRKRYVIDSEVGSGQYGKVFIGHDRENNNEIVAMKKFEQVDEDKYGLPIPLLREIQILKKLQSFRSDNIVHLRDIFMTDFSSIRQGNADIYMVMDYISCIIYRICSFLSEYADFDLNALLNNGIRFTEDESKVIMYYIFSGLRLMHKNGIYHRDIKDSNILVTRTGEVRICDFGLSRMVTKDDFSKCYSGNKITIPFRPPEVLLNCVYNSTADIWSAGCIMLRLLKGVHVIKGNNNLEVMRSIINLCGRPQGNDLNYLRECDEKNKGEKLFSGVDEKDHININKGSKRLLRTFAPNISKEAGDLLERIFQYDPKNRISAENAIRSPFFSKLDIPAFKEKMKSIQIPKKS